VAFSCFAHALSISLHMCTHSHNNLFLPNHKNALIVFSVSCPLSMLIYMCVHSHIRNCSLLIGRTFKTFFFGWLHCNETLNVTILIYVMNMTFIEMWHDLFFHCDENLNVTILINVMTQTFQFNSHDMRF